MIGVQAVPLPVRVLAANMILIHATHAAGSACVNGVFFTSSERRISVLAGGKRGG